MENTFAVRPRVPDLRSSDQGESGPKDKPKGEADGKSVKILIPVQVAKRGRSELGVAYIRNCTLKRKR